jgi:hypothetical protein
MADQKRETRRINGAMRISFSLHRASDRIQGAAKSIQFGRSYQLCPSGKDSSDNVASGVTRFVTRGRTRSMTSGPSRFPNS